MRILIFIFLFLLTALLSAQNNFEIQTKTRLAENYVNSGDLEKAIKLYEELIQLDPANNFYFESLNGLYIQMKNYAASVNLIEKEISKRPKDINLYGLLGSTYYMKGNEEKAFSVWEESLEYAENNAMFYRVIASYAVERRAFEKAMEIYRRGKEFSDDKTIFSFDLARLYSLTMQYDKSAEEYCSILKTDPSLLQTVETKILTDVKKPDALTSYISIVEDHLDENNLSLSYLLAKLSIEKKDFDRAYELYLGIDKKQSSEGAELYRYASLLYREREYNSAEKVYQSITDLFPGSSLIAASKLGYAKTLEALLMEEYAKHIPAWKPYFTAEPYREENVYEVINAFSEVIESYKKSETTSEALLRIGMINLYLLKDFNDAKIYFNRIINSNIITMSTLEAYDGLGEISLINGDLEQAEKNYLQITVFTNADPRSINNSKFKLAQVKLYEGHYKQTRKLLSEILKNLKDDNANDAIELSLLVNASKDDSISLKLFADAEFLVRQGKYNSAAEKYKLLADNPQAFIFHSIAKLRFAEMHLALNNLTESIESFGNIVDEGERNIYADKALYLLAGIFKNSIGDDAKAIELYEELLAKFPASIYIDKARAEITKLRNKIS